MGGSLSRLIFVEYEKKKLFRMNYINNNKVLFMIGLSVSPTYNIYSSWITAQLNQNTSFKCKLLNKFI